MKLFFVLSFCAWGQIEQPKLGIMLDRAGGARPVFGIAASVTIGDAVASDVLSVACSSVLCAASTSTGLTVWGQAGQWTANATTGTAIFAFDQTSLYVYSGQLARWNQGTLEPVGIQVSGEILSMRVVDGILEFAVRRDDGTWIVRDGDVVVAAVPEARGPVMLLDQAILFATPDEVVLRRADASERRFQVAGAERFIAMGDGYVQIKAGVSNYALRVAAGRETHFQLPEMP
jgi:hypothetical protein